MPSDVPDTVEVLRPGNEPDTKVFWASKTFWGAVLVVAGFVFKSFKVDSAQLDLLAGALAVLGGAGIAWGRQTAKKRLTWRRR